MRSAHPSAPLTGPDAPSTLEMFLDEHAKKVLLGVAVVLALVGIFATLHLKRKNYEREAGAALVAAKDMDALRGVMEKFGDTPAAATAALVLADRELAAGDAKGAEATLRAFLGAHKDHPLVSQARIALATALIRLGQPDAASAELGSFLQAAPTSSLAPLAMIMQAELAEAKGDTDGAKKLYEEAKANFPDSSFAMLASSRLERVGFVLPTEVEPPPPPPAAPEEIKPLPGSAVPPGISLPSVAPAAAGETQPGGN